MKRYEVILERPAVEDIDHYYQRAVEAGAGDTAARWYNRIVKAILSLEVAAEWRASIPEQNEFTERIHHLIFEQRYRILFTVVEDRVHVLCVRGPGMREMDPGDLERRAREARDD